MTIAELITQDADLTLNEFGEETALTLGMTLLSIASAENLPVVINIRTPDRTLFHVALPGSAPLNENWARRKSNVALMFQKSSLLVGAMMKEKGDSLISNGLEETHYAIHGGSLPIRVRGVGVVAAVTISGLPQKEDHALAVRGLESLLLA